MYYNIMYRCRTIFIILPFILMVTTTLINGKLCPGYCTHDLQGCKAKFGKIIGYCTNEKACCDLIAGVTGTCGSHFKDKLTTYFKSPNFPRNSSGDLTCEFKFDLYPTDRVIGVRIDFLEAKMDEMRFGSGKACDSDMIFIKGFYYFIPSPRCGNLNGYSTFIDRRDEIGSELRTLTLLALMSSPAYKWHIKIRQILKGGENTENSKPSKEKLGFLGFSSFELNDSLHKPNVKEKMSIHKFSDFNQRLNLDLKPSYIINGQDTFISQVPWQASIRTVYDVTKYTKESLGNALGQNCSFEEGRHFCGGSIISDELILTAAHCFFGTNKVDGMIDLSTTKVFLGDTNRCKNNSWPDDGDNEFYNATIHDIESVIFHYAYDDSLVDNDVAIIKLKKKIDYGATRKPIKLATKDADFTGNLAIVSGWGMTVLGDDSNDTLPDILQSTDEFLIIKNQSFCHQHLEKSIGANPDALKEYPKYKNSYKGVFCTGSKNSSAQEVLTGPGDSGGPLVVYSKNQGSNELEPILVGIVSYALTFKYSGKQQNKTEEYVDYFQSVPYFRNWIDGVMLSFK